MAIVHALTPDAVVAAFRQPHRFPPGRPTACAMALARRYGSYLLPLRMVFRTQAVDRGFARPAASQRNSVAWPRVAVCPVVPHSASPFRCPAASCGRLWWDGPPPAAVERTDFTVIIHGPQAVTVCHQVYSANCSLGLTRRAVVALVEGFPLPAARLHTHAFRYPQPGATQAGVVGEICLPHIVGWSSHL